MRAMPLDDTLVDELAGATGTGLVSVLMPTHVKGPEVAQDRIRLKNALTEVDGMLEVAGWRRPDREAHLEKARGLLTDEDFWAHQDRGLALYIDPDGDVRPVAMTDEPPQFATVAECFHVRHLLPALLRKPLDALVLTKGGVALYSVATGSIKQVEADLPASFEDANWFTDREPQEQRHADSRGSAGVQHGHDPTEDRTEDLHRFLRAVSHAVDEATPKGPIVVLGDDPVIEAFRRVTDRDVIPRGLDGTGRADSPAEIARRVRPMIDERHEALLVTHRDAAREALGTTDTHTLLPEALYAAVSGRLSHVYLRRDAAPIWGRFDADELEAAATGEREAGSVDLLDRLAVSARHTGASVLAMEGDADGCDFVAVRRF
ncbi:MAG TPA: hypothetical protein VMS74_01225 [Acidimicrobiia bacterium]|nr:hypothetical protein [Acidimicrobiia bacterium]